MADNEQRRQTAKNRLERQLAQREANARKRRTIAVVTTTAVVIAAVVGVFLVTRLGGGSDQRAADKQAGTTTESSAAAGISIPDETAAPPSRPKPLPNPVSCTYRSSGKAAKPVEPPENGEVSSQGTVNATIATNVGDIPITLDRSLAPCTVNSFVHLANQDFYNDAPCHRLSTRGLQMLQCGDPTGSGKGGPGYAFDDETYKDIKYGRGYLAMANSGPDTNGSQFFIVYGKAPLPSKYTVFGTVSQQGLKVVDKVARAGHDNAFAGVGGGHPNKKIKFTDVKVD